MSITILPYISDIPYTQASTTTNKPQVSTTDSFDVVMKAAMKATAAVAIDTLVKASEAGAVNASIVQQYFDEHNINITVPNVNTNDTDTTASNSKEISTPVAKIQANDAPASPDELDKYFEEAATTYNVDIKLLKAIAYCESNFNPNAVSSAGAIGVMQLMPATATELGVTDSYNARDNILGGAKLISQLLDKYDGDKSLALAAYNAGSGNVTKYGGIPPFSETQNYVRKVLDYYNS